MKNYISDSEIKSAKKVIRQIALEHGKSEKEVRQEMMLAIKAGMNNPDPSVQQQWASIPWRNQKPTVEEFIAWTTRIVQDQENHNI